MKFKKHKGSANELKSFRAKELQQGIATLPTVLALMILILAIAVGITALSFTESLISAGQSNSAQALQYAESGARDALERLARDKTYSCTSTTSSACYAINFAGNGTGCSTLNACAQVLIGTNSGTTVAPKIITSTGIVGNDIRVIQVQVVFDTSTYGQITTTTWTEVTQ